MPPEVTERVIEAGAGSTVYCRSPSSPIRISRVDAEVGGDLFQRDAGLAVARDTHDVHAELLRIRLGRCDILPGHLPAGQAKVSRTLQQSQPDPGPYSSLEVDVYPSPGSEPDPAPRPVSGRRRASSMRERMPSFR